MKTLRVHFDIQDFIESDTDQHDDIAERVNQLGYTFEVAFKASSIECAMTDNSAYYVIKVEDDRAGAVRELLEWITTANVQIED
jgi:DNA-binding ferritin-like protein